MKAAVITLHNVCNYGSQLQAYATQKKLEEFFDDVVFIDFRRKDTYGSGLLNTFIKGNLFKIPAIFPTLIYWKFLFGGFQKKYLKLTSKKYFSTKDFEGFEDFADVYFSGSDQIWNTGWNNGVIPAFYLDFVPDKKLKYSFASSFGKSNLNAQEIEDTNKYIARYKSISVREESGLKILNDCYGYKNAIRITDPVLSLSPDYWRSIAPKNIIQDEYILIYMIRRNKKVDDYAKNLSRITGLKLYRLCTRLDQIFRSGKSIIMPKIFDFITLIDNAKFVVTDSFHAAAFSMLLETPPVCFYQKDYPGRVADFLKLLNSEHRAVENYSDFGIIDRPVNFEEVRNILSAEREKTDNFLKSIKKEAEFLK